MMPDLDLADLTALREPADVLCAVRARLQGPLALVSGLGPQTLVLLDIVQRLELDIPLVMIDTGLLFAETYALRRRVEDRYGLTIRVVKPQLSLAEQSRRLGPSLWVHDPDRCCAIRKVVPLDEILGPLQGWVTGLRRDQSDSRADVQTVAWDEHRGLWKINPLAWWSRARVFAYLYARDVPFNPLLEQGYTSVGCTPCTRPVVGGEDERAGRWAGTGKTECGLHLPPDPALV